MLPLVDHAAVLLERLGRSAVPLPELVKLLRESGALASESVVLRSLAAEPERFRVIEPWRVLRAHRGVGEETWTAPAWIVPARGVAPADGVVRQRPALGRLRSTLVGLAWELDPSSSSDVARWFGMVIEAERFNDALPQDVRAAATTPPGRSAGAGASATPRPRPPLPARASAPPPPARARPPLPRGSH